VLSSLRRRRGSCFAPFICALFVAGHSALAQRSAADLEARLGALTGLERAQTLATLVSAHELDDPTRALQYGAEALRLFTVTPDAAANVSTLNEMGWASMTLGRYDSATFYLDSARRFAVRVGDRSGEARSLSNLGTLTERVGDPNRAVELFDQSLALQRALGDQKTIATSLNNLGFVYSTDLADYGRALQLHLEALSIREKLGDSASIALSLNNLGIVYDRLREYDRALLYFDRALRLRRAAGAKARVAATLNNIGDTYYDKGDYAHALSYQRQALQIRATLGDRSAVALSHRNIGLVYLATNHVDTARAELLAALQISDQLADKGLAAQIRLGLAKCERQAGAPANAENYAKAALALAESMKSRELVRQSTDELASDQESQGELSAALHDFKRSKAESDSIFNASTARRIAALEQMYSEERRSHEVDSLRGEQAEFRLRASERALQRDVAVGLALLVVVVGFFMYRRRVEHARMAEALSVTDALTGVWNRRYVHQTMQMDVAASLRRHRAMASRGAFPEDADLIFMMLDVDHFKRVNDEFGHAAGDQVLVQLGTVLRTTSRDSDIVVRWGGEEFLIIARFTNRQQAAATAERLRQAVERHVTTLADGRPIRITCSIGFAAFPFDLAMPDALGWDAVVALADQAGYAAKRAGRNAWVGLVRNPGTGETLAAPPAGQQDVERLIDEERIRQLASRPLDALPPRAPGTIGARPVV
jgi:diguanylate cyclase (GGDEF)-like protein